MAFDPKKDRLKKALGEELNPIKEEPIKQRRVGRPAGKTKRPYQFTIKPKNREKLDQMTQAAGYTSASLFLDEWIEGYDI